MSFGDAALQCRINRELINGADLARILWWFKDNPPRAFIEPSPYGDICLVRAGHEMNRRVALFTREDEPVYKHWFQVPSGAKYINLGRTLDRFDLSDHVGRVGILVIKIELLKKDEERQLAVTTDGDWFFENEADAVHYSMGNK